MKILAECNNKYSILFEKYMGRRPNIVKAQLHLENVMKKIEEVYGAKSKTNTNIMTINISKDMKDMNALLGKEFNTRMDVMWNYSISMNAITIPSAIIMDDPRKGKVTNTPYIHIQLMTGLVTEGGLDSEQVMAILLHEIGHNFYKSSLHTLNTVARLMTIPSTSIPTIIASMGLTQSSLVRGVLGYMMQIKGIASTSIKPVRLVMDVLNKVDDVFKKLLGNSLKLPIALANLLTSPIGWALNYHVEKGSDSFAIDYGYGVPLSSGLDIISGINRGKKKFLAQDIPVIGMLYDIDFVVASIVLGVVGTYPSVDDRVYTALARIEEYKNDRSIPDSLKKEINVEYIKLKEYCDERANMPEEERRMFTKLYLQFLQEKGISRMDIRDSIKFLDKDYYTR